MKELLKDKGFLRLTIIFILVSAIAIVFSSKLTELEVDPVVVGFGNLIIYLASVLTLLLYGRAKNASTSHGFSRNVYAAFVTKFFVLVTAAMLYFYFSDRVEKLSVRAVFVCLALYFVYHFAGAVHAARVEKKKVKHHH
jgi:hypothetical protein